MKVFGNDGFRSKFGYKYMTIEFLSAFSFGIVDYYKNKDYDLPILIGRDTRSSGLIIEKLLVSIFNYGGINTVTAGIIPTPSLSFILKHELYSMGIMITASHNPYYDNGIKLYSNNGFKFLKIEEKMIERNILKRLNRKSYIFEGKIGIHKKPNLLYKKYAFGIKNIFKKVNIADKILIDCSNGAFSHVAKIALKDYPNVVFINVSPNGHNINLKCGALESVRLLKIIRENKFDYGIAFDGDGDRAIFVSSKYGIIETEKLIVLFSKLLNQGSKTVISTEICNKGLEENLNNIDYKLIQTKVGDRIVVETAIRENAMIGAEPSGHYYFPNCSNTMDGLIAVFYFFELLEKHNNSFIKVLNDLKHFRRIKKNIPLENTEEINLEYLRNTVKPIIDDRNEKFIIRQSMWDPVLRIYYDYKKKNNFGAFENIILNNLHQTSE
jgi:phosphoglucosamine mutase